MRYPLANPQIKAGFGISPWPITGSHTGCDYVAPTGTPLYPISSGTVSWVNINHPTMGNALEINIGGGKFTRYLHCSQILVAIGQSVSENQEVARAGFTGYVEPAGDRGAHLHAELYGKANNQPANYQDIDAYIRNNGGTTMESMSDDTGRQVQYHYLGEDGYDGRPNALTSPSRLKGSPMTNKYFGEVFLGEQSRTYRDITLPKVYADRDLYKVQRDGANQQVTVLTTQLEAQLKVNTELNTSITKLQSENAQLTDDNEDLNALVKEQADDIKELEAQLATCDSDGANVVFNINVFNIFRLIVKKSKGEK